jgi:hypothetical protein
VSKIGAIGTTLAVTGNGNTLLVTANVVTSLPILVTLLMVAIRLSETSVLTRGTRHNIQEDGIFSYTSWFVSKQLLMQ